MTLFLIALDAEIADLKRSLADDPRHRKLEELTRLRGLYDSPADPRPVAPVLPARVDAARTRNSKNQATIDEVAAHLARHKDRPIKTSDILAYLDLIGADVRGVDRRNTLSAMMSHSGQFLSHGKKGWTLKPSAPLQNAEAANASSPGKDAFAASNEPRLTTEGTQGWSSIWPQDSGRVNPRPGGGT